MNGGSRIIAFGSSDRDELISEQLAEEPVAARPDEQAREAESIDEVQEPEFDVEATEISTRSYAWIAAVIAVFAVAGWTAFFAWAHSAKLTAQAPAAQWTGLIAEWSLPVLVVALGWLLIMRSSPREAERVGRAAKMLSHQSTELETRLVTVNRELSLAREFLASQTRELESLGRLATERLSQNADRLQELVQENGTRVNTIGEVSQNALDNMEKLRGQLPVIASSAKDVTNNIGNAGRTAHSQIEEMVSGFNRINDFGQACERQVTTLRQTVDVTLAGFESQCAQMESIAQARFVELNERGDEFRTKLDQNEVAALAAIRQRAKALSEELDVARGALASLEDEGLESLGAKIQTLRSEGTAVAQLLREGEAEALSGWRDGLVAIEEERAALLARLEEADSGAAERTKERLAQLAAETGQIEAGIAERAETLAAVVAERREAAEQADRETVSRFGEVLADLDRAIAERADLHDRHAERMATLTAQVAETLGDSQSQIASIAENASYSGERINESLAAISNRVGEARQDLFDAEAQLMSVTDSSVRLLELLQASAEQTRATLPQSLDEADTALTAAESRVRAITETLAAAGGSGDRLAGQIGDSGSRLQEMLAEIDTLQTRLQSNTEEHRETLAGLGRTLGDMDDATDALSRKTREDLMQAIAEAQDNARETAALISDEGSKGLFRIAEEFRETSAGIIGKAVHNSVADVSGQLEQAASHAAGVSREATVQLRDQLAKVHELVGNLESRVSRARERAEQQVDNDFARRAALITESLNSNAIDIAKALSTEVSDTAWESYLRGDRGIFTRRAVSLVDNGDARTIQQVYEQDGDFREHVSRYIHDFEAILREVLSTRDGTALGVTLLSSDMGKLYVALAQSIERLRA